jgi:peptide chain release factor subunit 1
MASVLEEALDRLSRIESSSPSILSVYLSLYPDHIEWASIRPRLHNLIDPVEKLAASGDLNHDTSMALRAATEHVLAMAGALERLPSKGVAVFICDELGFREQLPLPRRVWDFAVVGPAPYLRPLQAVLDEFRRIAVVVLDSRHAEIFSYYMGEILGREVIEAEELRKTNLAGWYGLDEFRHRQHGEQARNHLFREVAGRLGRMGREGDIDLVLVGGHHDATHALLPYLEQRTRAITETFVVDLHTLTPGSLIKRVTELEESYERREEAREVDEVYSLAGDGDLGAIGVDRVLEAASHHAITRLFVHDGAAVDGSVCTSCGALSRPTETCMRCGAETRPLPDAIEALSRAVIEAGGSVEHVMTETRLAEDLVAARLRFAPW